MSFLTFRQPVMDVGRASLPIAAIFVLAACAGAGAPSDDPPASDRPVRSDHAAEPVASESESAVIGEVPEELMAQILADAADRAETDADALEVLRAEAVTWNDGSLGCPEPDMTYTQALVDGYHVVIDAGGTELDYRAAGTGTFRLCENPGRPAGG
jgi:hypothetical protein